MPRQSSLLRTWPTPESRQECFAQSRHYQWQREISCPTRCWWCLFARKTRKASCYSGIATRYSYGLWPYAVLVWLDGKPKRSATRFSSSNRGWTQYFVPIPQPPHAIFKKSRNGSLHLRFASSSSSCSRYRWLWTKYPEYVWRPSLFSQDLPSWSSVCWGGMLG